MFDEHNGQYVVPFEEGWTNHIKPKALDVLEVDSVELNSYFLKFYARFRIT